MSGQICISLSKVSKFYKLYDSPVSKLKQFLCLGLRRYYVEFPALQEIDLEIKQGETIGVIGHNGAGKSTLLELVSRLSAPTTGAVDVRGKIVSLLELGGGFISDFTGRENVFLYGAVLGMRREEIRAQFDAIVAFADIGGFIDQPVRTYSNGMLMRLAFSVSTHVDADILVFDEVLAVGDGNFQYKCFQRIRDLQEKGVTIILVSHNMDMVASLCSRVVILDHGKKYFEGGAKEAFWAYCRLVSLPHAAQSSSAEAPMGTGEGKFISAGVYDEAGQRRSEFRAGEKCQVRLGFATLRDIPRGSFGIVLQDRHAAAVYGYNTASDPCALFSWRAGSEYQVVIHLSLNLAPGKYYLSLVLNQIDAGKVVSLGALESFAEISITDSLGVFGASNLFSSFTQEMTGKA